MAGAWLADTYVPLPNLGNAGLTVTPPGLMTTSPNGSFSPSCYYPFMRKSELLHSLLGKSFLMIGDSHTRTLVLALLKILDDSHTEMPLNKTTWFNNSALQWPHVNKIEYYIREDSHILQQFAGNDHQEGPSEPSANAWSIRLTYLMIEVRNVS